MIYVYGYDHELLDGHKVPIRTEIRAPDRKTATLLFRRMRREHETVMRGPWKFLHAKEEE